MNKKNDILLLGWANREKEHLEGILDKVVQKSEACDERVAVPSDLSDKAMKLVELLEASRGQPLVGLLFSQQRKFQSSFQDTSQILKTRADNVSTGATVWALGKMLCTVSQTRHLRVGTFVGTSLSVNRNVNISELANIDAQQQSLVDFREGRLDLIISTDVLSEGIDVPSANVVICFDPPQNLVSFIQRRGRARQPDSQYLILQPSHSSPPKEWVLLEQQMVDAYLEIERQTQAALEAEAVEETAGREFRIKSTR